MPSVPWPFTVTIVCFDEASATVINGVFTLHSEKEYPALASAETLTWAPASYQSAPDGTVAPAPGGLTVKATSHCAA